MIHNGKKNTTKSLAIIGAGPRGLSALESVYFALASRGKLKDLKSLLFEGSELPGAGHVYDVGQLYTNWLNVSERGLTIPKREKIKCGDLVIPSFPSYQKWAGYDAKTETFTKSDKFPVRAELGKYLNERYRSIASTLQSEGLLMVVREEVVETDWKEEFFEIVTKNGNKFQADEVVLTIGHQPTNSDDQITNWTTYSRSNGSVAFHAESYPVKNLLKSELLGPESIVAIRGFGLAMIDVMRALTQGFGGEFKDTGHISQRMTYVKSGREPRKIVPFSLDGLPMAPKPLNLEVDQWFFPTDKEKKYFGAEVSRIAQMGEAQDHRFLIDLITPIITRVFKGLGDKAIGEDLKDSEVEELIKSWLSDGKFEHHLIVPKSDPAEKALESFVAMAIGSAQISLDFCIGHVWRHCQPTLYKAISFSNLADDVILEVVALDERLKRYSYGPPVASLQQLLALVRAAVISLDFVDNPDIKTTAMGWELSKGDKKIQATTMVNSVLDSPKLLDIKSPIVKNLLKDLLVRPVHGQLGIVTDQNACVSLSEEQGTIPLAVLGRLSKGTLVGVDAILECFGTRSDLWAEGLVDRMSSNDRP